jgi:hypothetical protein
MIKAWSVMLAKWLISQKYGSPLLYGEYFGHKYMRSYKQDDDNTNL